MSAGGGGGGPAVGGGGESTQNGIQMQSVSARILSEFPRTSARICPSPSGDGRKSSLKSSPSSQSANGESDAGQEEAGARWEGQGRVDRMTGAHTEEPPQTGVSDLRHARRHAHTYTHVHARTRARSHTHTKLGPKHGLVASHDAWIHPPSSSHTI